MPGSHAGAASRRWTRRGALDAQPARAGTRPLHGQPWIRGTLRRRAPTRSRRPLRAHRSGSRRPQLTPGAHISELGFARETFPVGSFRNQHPRGEEDGAFPRRAAPQRMRPARDAGRIVRSGAASPTRNPKAAPNSSTLAMPSTPPGDGCDDGNVPLARLDLGVRVAM